jgi:hypothetical protein
MIDAGRGNEWFVYGKMAVYIRIGKKMIHGDLRTCVQIANLGTPTQYQGKGIFTRLLQEIKDTTDLPIYIEQILNRQFFEALLRRGFVPPKHCDDEVFDLVFLSET